MATSYLAGFSDSQVMSPNGADQHRALEDEPRRELAAQGLQHVANIPVPVTPPMRSGSALRVRSEGSGAPRKALEMLAAIDQGEQMGPSGPTGNSGEQRMVQRDLQAGIQGAQLEPRGSAGNSLGSVAEDGGIRARLPPLPQMTHETSPVQHGRLFSEEQYRQLEMMQSQAPQLYGQATGADVRFSTPQKLSQEELKSEAERLHVQWQLEKEKAEMLEYMKTLHQENMKLKVQLAEAEDREVRYTTPESLGGGGRADEPASMRHGRKDDRTGDDVKSCIRTFGFPDRARSRSPQRQDPGRGSAPRGEDPEGGQARQDQTVNVMLKLMEGMQAMQEQLLQHQTSGGGKTRGGEEREEEVIRTGIQLHALPEWSMESAPVDFQDWILLISPQMSDLTTSSHEWWNATIATAKQWYEQHQALKPLEKLKHAIQPTMELQQKRWARLEKRASSLLLEALPSSQKEDIISTKSLTVLNILGRLMQNYQPGGAHEKTAVLSALENPQEASSVAEVITGLRKWIRWKKRASDINVALPDPTVLLRGLDNLVTKILSSHPTSHFRINLTRSDLMVDAMPTLAGVDQYAECLLAEFDQMSYSRRREKGSPAAVPPKVKKFEDAQMGQGGQGGGAQKQPGGKGLQLCKYYNTEDGCKKGKSCRFRHEAADSEKRCWVCGSTKHFSGKCPTKADEKASPARVQKLETDKRENEDAKSDKGAICPSEDMKGLLEEASRMLKTMNSSSTGDSVGIEEPEDPRIKLLQRQLDELKGIGGRMKVLRIARVHAAESAMGLLDSGATHALRPRYPFEDTKGYRSVVITLAGDRQVSMKMSPGGVIVGKEDTEPIVPMGQVVRELGCTVQWLDTHVVISHPTRGQIPVQLCGGCPMLEKDTAMALIQELEGNPSLARMQMTFDGMEGYAGWIKRLAREHPALHGVPEDLLRGLEVQPVAGITAGNRRLRKLWKREGGVILSLYSGLEEGFTMRRAVKDLAGDPRKVIQVDLQNGEQWNMVEGPLYAELMYLAVTGQLGTIIGGPNCRTRSKLRHVPREGFPGPSRGWAENQQWGLSDASPEEKRKCFEDDLMMLRLVVLYLVAEETRKAGGAINQQDKTGLLIEHPAAPEDNPEVVSWWWTSQWKALRNTYNLSTYDLDQGELGGLAYKPTTLGTNMILSFPEQKVKNTKKIRRENGMSPEEIAMQTKSLARWCPVMMSGIAEACMRTVGQAVKRRLYSWRTHLARGHVPFRKDCQVCQEAAARDRPHQRSKLPPKAGVLSLDTAGPYCLASDVGSSAPGSRGLTAKFILVGTFTWITGETGGEIEEEVHEAPADSPELAEEVDLPLDHAGDADDLPVGEEDGDVLEEEEGHDMPQVEVFRLALPMQSKAKDEVLKTISEMYLTLRSDGFVVRQIHTDRGGEFMSGKLQTWCRNRDILRTHTTGSDSKLNGRAERAVLEIKNRVRILLHGAGVDQSWWPLAVRNVNERWRMQRLRRKDEFPPFLSEVLMKKRWWQSGDLDPTHEKVRYLCPSWADHGHWVIRQDGTKALTRSIIRGTTQPLSEEIWYGLMEEMDPVVVRRRLRGKTPMRKMGDDEPSEDVDSRIEQVIQQEMECLLHEDGEVASLVLGGVLRLCEFANNEAEDVEQVLQTRIVSPAEVLRQQEEWRGAIQAEIDSLFVTKEALKVISSAEAKHIMDTQDVQAVPSKVVFTLKPDPEKVSGKKKCRIVACGNFAREEENQDLVTSGADATSLRMALSMASQMGWWGANLDIRTAFLNAPMKHAGGPDSAEMELKKVLLKPANILVKMGFFSSTEYWEVMKALYGFRQSPKLWSDHRDMVMREMRVGEFFLIQMESEPAMWTIRRANDEHVYGLVVTYVDDILVLAEKHRVQEWTDCFSRTWETTKPEWIGEHKPTRFLGMEMFRRADGSWRLNQVNYTCDLLRRNLGKDEAKWGMRRVPLSKDGDAEQMEDGAEADETLDPASKLEKVREAQRIVGELVWLVTRCRPDLMYALNRMAVWTTRQPGRVITMAPQVWKFLAQSRNEGLVFPRGDGGFGDIEVFTDASFGEECQGCVVVKWAGAPILWKSSRQTIQTTSTAGAELFEIMEGAIMSEAIRVIAEELRGDKIRCWQFTDSASALSIVVGDTSSWRTKHLRRRARFLRWRVLRGDIIMRHLPGLQMVADLGTKALTATRFRDLKELLGMMLEDEGGAEVDVQRGTPPLKIEVVEKAAQKVESRPQSCEEVSLSGGEGFRHLSEGDRLKMAIVLAVLARAAGMKENSETELYSRAAPILVSILVVVATGMIAWLGRWWSGDSNRQDSQEEILPLPASDEGAEKEDETERDVIPLAALLQGATEEDFAHWEAEHARDMRDAPGSSDGESVEGELGELMTTQIAGVTVMREVYVSTQGRRYHYNWLCPGLGRAEYRIGYEWCVECMRTFREGATLMLLRDQRLMHLEGSHGMTEGQARARRFRPCRFCVFER